MAQVTLNLMIDDIRGKIGGFVLRRAPSGKLILSKAPDMSNVKWSKAQKENRKRFKQAVAYSKAAMAEPTVRAHYENEAVEKGKRPYDLAVSDYFKEGICLGTASDSALDSIQKSMNKFSMGQSKNAGRSL